MQLPKSFNFIFLLNFSLIVVLVSACQNDNTNSDKEQTRPINKELLSFSIKKTRDNFSIIDSLKYDPISTDRKADTVWVKYYFEVTMECWLEESLDINENEILPNISVHQGKNNDFVNIIREGKYILTYKILDVSNRKIGKLSESYTLSVDLKKP